MKIKVDLNTPSPNMRGLIKIRKDGNHIRTNRKLEERPIIQINKILYTITKPNHRSTQCVQHKKNPAQLIDLKGVKIDFPRLTTQICILV
jgi:hypothetical protein